MILDALSFLWPSKKEIVAWADRRVAEPRDPPGWVIDLSTMNSPRLADYITVLEANESERCLTTEEKVLMCLDSYESGAMNLSNTLGALSSIWLGEGGETIRFDPALEEVLSWWDQVDGHGNPMSEDLKASAHRTFDQFRRTHGDLRNPLPGLKTDKGQQVEDADAGHAPG